MFDSCKHARPCCSPTFQISSRFQITPCFVLSKREIIHYKSYALFKYFITFNDVLPTLRIFELNLNIYKLAK